LPAVALFAVTSLVIGLTAGSGLGVWLLWARVWGVGLVGLSWPVLVQIHGQLQLFGFAGLLAMGIALHALPRFRGAPPVARGIVATVYVTMVLGIGLRALAQPAVELPARSGVLALAGVLLCAGSLTFAAASLRSLVGGRNAHRADELVIGAGISALPIAALFVALEMAGGAPMLVDLPADDRAVWTMLLGSLCTLIFGVWARLAPGFVAAMPARPRPLVAGAIAWLAGVAAIVFELPAGPWLLLVGLAALSWSMGVFARGIARQRLEGHARLTRSGVRSAFGWAFVGVAILAFASLDVGASYLRISAARHAFALGFVTVMIYSVGARALPAFLGRRLWSLPLQVATLVAAELGVALRVVPQALAVGPAGDVAIGISGALAYVALVLFAVNVGRTLRGPRPDAIQPGTPVAITLQLGR
jgi:hypothetical protein